MNPATRALVHRVLALHEAAGRAALAAARREHARCAAEAAARAEDFARERAAARDHAAPPAALAAWRDAAAAGVAAAQTSASAAEAACAPPREALADTLRTRHGFDALMERRDAEAARIAARRDPLLHLMVLGQRHGG